ncbi:MAG: hypothetical protein ACREM3_12740 [Candidatus Rokuibacteriota bacterium]
MTGPRSRPIFSDRTYSFLSKFFTLVMIANIVLVLAITLIAARPQHDAQVLLGCLGITFLMESYPAALPRTDALTLFDQPGGSLMGSRSGSSPPASATAAAGYGVSRLNTWLLWIIVVTGFGGVGYWAIAVLPGKIAKRFGG